MWAIGCIYAELLSLRPIFKGDEAKLDGKKGTLPFQRDQMGKICDVLGPIAGESPISFFVPARLLHLISTILSTIQPSEWICHASCSHRRTTSSHDHAHERSKTHN